MFETAQKFSTHVEFPRNEETSTSEWTATYNRLKDTIRPLLDTLEEHFRGMLGINAMFSDIVAEQSGEPEPPMTPNSKY